MKQQCKIKTYSIFNSVCDTEGRWKGIQCSPVNMFTIVYSCAITRVTRWEQVKSGTGVLGWVNSKTKLNAKINYFCSLSQLFVTRQQNTMTVLYVCESWSVTYSKMNFIHFISAVPVTSVCTMRVSSLLLRGCLHIHSLLCRYNSYIDTMSRNTLQSLLPANGELE